MSEPQEGYQGWSNFETWGVALILDNDEPCYKKVYRECKRVGAGEAEEFLKGYVEHMASLEGSTVYDLMKQQLIQAAIDRVNWRELAEHYREE